MAMDSSFNYEYWDVNGEQFDTLAEAKHYAEVNLGWVKAWTIEHHKVEIYDTNYVNYN